MKEKKLARLNTKLYRSLLEANYTVISEFEEWYMASEMIANKK